MPKRQLCAPRDTAPQPTDNAERMVATQRKKHSADEFSRRLTISSSPRATKLYNLETDVIPMRRTAEPEAMSHSAHAVAKPKPQSSQRLFDHQRDDLARFFVQARKPTPTPKSSGDYSSTSSYAPSTSSSNFTLTSDSTTDSSSPSSLFDRKPRDESKTNAFSAQLKKLYRDISALEAKILQDSGEVTPDDSRVLLKGGSGNEDPESLRWKKAVEDHKA
ncbi:hypothetical protein FA95DRAFT_1655407 [Auriscalpium vulgare]|uniref:Uncharacterized protein n=1 Tax=Auriscalpium vulgare TaxID=40419 RepID=A0ACB8R6E5_9AGAM|nr:hypothetical protein FA95DRAFT_1655407 [Auriscalpium vulgare]